MHSEAVCELGILEMQDRVLSRGWNCKPMINYIKFLKTYLSVLPIITQKSGTQRLVHIECKQFLCGWSHQRHI